jgi:acyl-coenzyme A thioesterase PaaI-like protein
VLSQLKRSRVARCARPVATDTRLTGLTGRTGRTATAEAKVRDADGNLVALGTRTFRVFEKKCNAIV